MDTLKNKIASLAEAFATDVVHAISGASLQELMAERGRSSSRPPKSGGATADRTHGGVGPAPKRKRGGRLARRSAADIERVIGRIVGALKGNKKGLRSEELQKTLKLDKREITGPLVQALASKKITKKGQKRSTTYFAG